MPDNERRGRARDEYTQPKIPVAPPVQKRNSIADLIKSIVEAPVKAFVGSVGAAVVPPNMQPVTQAASATAAEGVLKTIKPVVEPVVKTASWYDQHIWKPWSQVEATLATTVGTELNAIQQGDFYNPVNVWDKAWQASDRNSYNPITPGQASLFLFQNIPVIKQVYGMIAPDNAVVNDLFSETERNKYKTNPYLKWSSTAADFANNIFADPTVIGGKVFKAARLVTLNPLVDVEKGIFRTAEQRAAFEAGAAERMAAREQADIAAQRVRDHDVAIVDTVEQQFEIKRQMEEAASDPTVFYNPAGYEKLMVDLHEQWKVLDTERTALIVEADNAAQRLAAVRETYMPPASAGAQTFIDAVHDYGYSAHEIMQNYTIREFGTNSATAASIIDAAAKLGDKTITTDALRALTGDVNAYQRLYDKATVVHEMLRRAQGDLSHMDLHLKSMEKFGGDVASYVAETTTVRDRISAELDDLINYDGFLRQAIGPSGNPMTQLRRQFARADVITDPMVSTAKFLPGAAGEIVTKVASKLDDVFGLIEAARIGKSASKAAIALGANPDAALLAWKSRTYQFHYLARPVTVVQRVGNKFAREVPSGFVVTHGMGSEDGVREVEAWLNSVPAWKDKPDLKKNFMDLYIGAGRTEHGSESFIGDLRSMVLLKMERQAFLDMAAARDPKWLTPIGPLEKGKNQRVLADQIWEQYEKRRARLVKSVLATRDAGKGRPGYFVDDSGKIITIPGLDSQLAYSHPMLDAKIVNDAFKEASAEQMGGLIKKLNSGGDILQTGITGLYTFIDRIWRPATLLRLGYPIRNTAEGTLRSIAYNGSQVVAMAPFVGQGAKAWSQNRWARWQQKIEAVQQQSALTREGIATPKVPLYSYIWGNTATWGEHLEDALVMQREQLNNMREGHRIVFDAHVKSLEADLVEAQDLVRELTAREKAGEDVAESLTAARGSVRSIGRELRDAKETFTAEVIAAQEAKVAKLEQTFRDFNDTLAKPGSKLNRIKGGTGEFAVNGTMVEGAFTGVGGGVLRDMVSSDTRAQVDLNLNSTMLLDEGMAFGKKAQIFNPPNVNGLTIDEVKGSAGYWPALENWVHQLRNDTLAEKMLKPFTAGGNYDEQILESVAEGIKFLQSAEGRSYVDRVKSIGDYDPDMTPTQIAYDRLTHLMAASGEKQDLLVRFATDKKRILAPELRRELFDNPHLQPVHGLEVIKFKEFSRKEGYFHAFNKVYEGFVRKMFKHLGSMPEDAFVRHPFARLAYNTRIKELVSNWQAQGGDLTQDIVDRMVADARQFAAKETRKTLYTILREKKIGSTRIAKAFSPFIQAQANTISTWGKLLYNNPESFGYVQQIWRNIDKLGTVDTDPDTGEKYITFQLPAAVANAVQHVSPAMAEAIRVYGSWAFPKSGANVIFSGIRGNDPITQLVQATGVGPIVQIPLGTWISNVPDIDQQIRNTIGIHLPARWVLSKLVPDDQLPRATSLAGAIAQGFMPAWGRNIDAEYKKNDSYRFGQTALLLTMTKVKSFLEDPSNADKDLEAALPKMYKQAEREASMFMFVRTVVNLSLPVIPKYQTKLQPYINQLRQYQDQYGGEKGFAKFVEENPNAWFINASLTSSASGMDSTTRSVYLAKKNHELMDEVTALNPRFASMVTDTVEVGEFDTAANLWKRKQQKFIVKKDAVGAIEDAQIAMGWNQKHLIDAAVDAALKARGLTSVQQDPRLALGKAVLTETLARKFPAWGREQDNVNKGAWKANVEGAYRVAFNPAIIKDTQNYNHMKWVRAYFEFRGQVVAELERRRRTALAAQGLANAPQLVVEAIPWTIDRKEAADLQAARDYYVAQLKSSSPMFAQFYDRWLDSDKFSYVKGVK